MIFGMYVALDVEFTEKITESSNIYFIEINKLAQFHYFQCLLPAEVVAS